jgi:hypothetical protein|tara:strand:- start:652 stop:831 length:180 start_codon:yes stop_codon:yes gene_type:complete
MTLNRLVQSAKHCTEIRPYRLYPLNIKLRQKDLIKNKRAAPLLHHELHAIEEKRADPVW